MRGYQTASGPLSSVLEHRNCVSLNWWSTVDALRLSGLRVHPGGNDRSSIVVLVRFLRILHLIIFPIHSVLGRA